MARRLLNAAKIATQLAAWSDLEDNILDDGSSVITKDSEHDLLSAGDDETNDNMNDSSFVNSQDARMRAEDKMSDSSKEESDSDSTKSSDTVAQSTFRERNGQVWTAACPTPSRTHA